MKTVITLFFCAVLSITATSQTSFGYLGKRFYIKGAFSASPSIFSRNLNGTMVALKFNKIGTISGNMVLNKKHVLALNYKRYSSVASVNAEGEGLFVSQILNSSDYSGTNESNELGDYRFTTNEIGFNYQFFTNDLDAPLGAYVSIGMGLAFSKYDVPFQVVTSGYDGYNTYNYIVSFDNTKSIKSPIIRFGFGKQTVFWNRLLFDYGLDIGLNLGFVGSQLATAGAFFDFGSSNSSSDLDQEQLDFVSKKAVQNRVFMMNLFNFKMGLAYLLF